MGLKYIENVFQGMDTIQARTTVSKLPENGVYVESGSFHIQ